MGKITYDNKIQLNENANIPNNQKCRAVDMNEIKNIVNGNDDEFIQYKSNIATGETYSTNEIKTNKVWIDGKPIYRKTIAFNYTTNSINAIPLNINNYKEIWLDLSDSFIKYDGTRIVPIVRADYRDIQYSVGAIIDITNSTVSLQIGKNIPSGNGYITVLYTKTTD